jgi:hypothetical protein
MLGNNLTDHFIRLPRANVTFPGLVSLKPSFLKYHSQPDHNSCGATLSIMCDSLNFEIVGNGNVPLCALAVVNVYAPIIVTVAHCLQVAKRTSRANSDHKMGRSSAQFR